MPAKKTYHVSEVYGVGDEFPVPGPAMFTVEATNAVEALNAYCDREGFAPYSLLNADEPDAIIPHVWTESLDIASAPFMNTEIMAYTDEAMRRERLFDELTHNPSLYGWEAADPQCRQIRRIA